MSSFKLPDYAKRYVKTWEGDHHAVGDHVLIFPHGDHGNWHRRWSKPESAMEKLAVMRVRITAIK